MRQICKAGGFHLSKIIRNDKEVLATIPEEDKKAGCKKSRLDNRQPSNRKSSWNSVESGT